MNPPAWLPKNPITLITGATGFIGRSLTEKLAAMDFPVHALCLRQGTHPHFTCGNITPHYGDLCDPEFMDNLMRRLTPQLIINCAAYGVIPNQEDPIRMQAVNAGGPLNLLNGIGAGTPARLIHLGSWFEKIPVENLSDTRIRNYSRAKALATRTIRQWPLADNQDAVIIRPFTVFGPGEADSRFFPTVMRALKSGQPAVLGDPDQACDFIYIDDLIEGLIATIRSEACSGKIIEIGSGHSQSLRTVAETIAARMNRTLIAQWRKNSRSALPEMAADRQMVKKLTGWQPKLTLEEAIDRYIHAKIPSSTKSLSKAAPPTAQKQEILHQTKSYFKSAFAQKPFKPFEDRVPYAGRVFDEQELINLVDSALDFWLTLGPYGHQLESCFKEFFGAKRALLVNSGSSANLLAVATICSPQVKRRARPGDEVITPAVTFPTTLAPILQYGLIPVFIDTEPGAYSMRTDLLEEALSPRTRAIFVPHTLGNPWDLMQLRKFADKHGLWLIEDSCDALGSRFSGRLAGSYGDLATLSFYPAHHMTMGEGGALIVNRSELMKPALSLRDWGRDCWCAPGEDNTCGRRFEWQLGQLPKGYDHKYIYSHLGYNLKPTDMQAAIGVAQFEKLDDFTRARQDNFNRIFEALEKAQLPFTLPKWHTEAEPSWFGFPLTAESSSMRRQLNQWLFDAKIETRQIFAGNILKQPALQGQSYRVVGDLTESDRIMNGGLFFGVYPGLKREMVDFIIERLLNFKPSIPARSSKRRNLRKIKV